ncbi:ribonuclease R [Ignatzschineria sp. RMDPL8A]|uniref:ribonuclease R n=1 Tax=Ignatzschineria sp. RMDPL8A TaxID=2999236 RepID=UPI0024466C40|nr:ribonuclease R [Ignatzschineria sp. RMDPL8A]MDG9730498.1 ribonuclease R [Ignatzschineria sp. RMDPL8A]
MSQNDPKTDEYFIRFKENDPEYAVQVEQYGKAIPSRDFILELLEFYQSLDRTIDFDGVSRAFKLRKVWELDALENRLNAMIRQGQIYLNQHDQIKKVDPSEPIEGIVQGKAEGFGYLDPIDPDGKGKREDSLFIPPYEMEYLLHNDRVKALPLGTDRRGRRIAKITEIVERGFTEFFARVHREEGSYILVPENRDISQHFLVPQDSDKLQAKHLDIVRAKVTQYPDKNMIAMAEIVEVFGDTATVDIEIEQALLEHNIPNIFSAEVEYEVSKIPNKVLESEHEGRKDYRDLPLVTIDGITARDFDDAVYCKPIKDGYRLYVAIADVSHYARRGSAIDKEAHLRGTSVYFPRKVVPMLHRDLSNGICSLNPDVDRLAMVAELDIDHNGELQNYHFYEGVMRSHARLTYDLVFDIISGDELLRESYKELTPDLDNLYNLFKVLRKQREKRGALDFETVETLILYDEEGHIEKIVPDSRNDAHKIIEECMITANIAAAKFLEKLEINGLYRVHNTPDPAKLGQLRSFLKEFNIGLGGGENPSPLDFSRALEAAKEKNEFEMIQTVMLRSLSQAVYQPENSGHFGLSLSHYAHFTSPIRRYPDLLVHRAIKHIIRKRDKNEFYNDAEMIALGEHCSMTERRAEDAERDVIAWLKASYMQNFIGDEFEGHITGVTNFGLFIELEDIFIEGLVHISQMDGDFFIYDEIKHRLMGEHTGFQYRLNDKVKIRVVEANPETKHIDFTLLSPVIGGDKNSGKNAGSRPPRRRSNNDSKGHRGKSNSVRKKNDRTDKKSRRNRRKKRR